MHKVYKSISSVTFVIEIYRHIKEIVFAFMPVRIDLFNQVGHSILVRNVLDHECSPFVIYYLIQIYFELELVLADLV